MSDGQWSRRETSVKNCTLRKIINARYLRTIGRLDTLRLNTSLFGERLTMLAARPAPAHAAQWRAGSALSCYAFRFRLCQHYFDNNRPARHAQASDTLVYLGNEQRFTDFSDWLTLALPFLPACRRYFALAKIVGRLSFAIVFRSITWSISR